MINTHKVYIIAAVDDAFGIGKGGDLAWRLRKDMQHFKRTTESTEDTMKLNAVIMGRTTWESIPEQFRPLDNRTNIVLTSDAQYEAPGASVATSFDDALSMVSPANESIFIIGGGRVYAEAMTHEAVDGIYLTKIHHTFDCDVQFPKIPALFTEVETLGTDTEDDYTFDFLLYLKNTH